MIAPSLQKKVLLLLLALWAMIGGAMMLWGSKDDKGAAAPVVRKLSPARAVAAKSRGELDLIPWGRQQAPLQPGSHNPFHPLAGYLEPPPPPPGAKLKTPPPPPPDPFMEELKTFKYFGYAEDQNKKVAFLGKGRNSYTVKEKDLVEGKFLVKKITEEYVVLGETQGPKELTIAQSGYGESAPGAAAPSWPFFTPPPPGSPYPSPPRPPFYTSPPSSPPTTPAPKPPPTARERRGPGDRPLPMPPPRAPLSKGGE